MSILTWSLASLALAYVSMVVGLAAFQRRLQYFPDRRLVHLAQTGMRGGEEQRPRQRWIGGDGLDAETLAGFRHALRRDDAESSRATIRMTLHIAPPPG